MIGGNFMMYVHLIGGNSAAVEMGHPSTGREGPTRDRGTPEDQRADCHHCRRGGGGQCHTP